MKDFSAERIVVRPSLNRSELARGVRSPFSLSMTEQTAPVAVMQPRTGPGLGWAPGDIGPLVTARP